MLASKNLLKPADGEPIISPSKDMVLGVYYLTMTDRHRITRAMAVSLPIWTKSIWLIQLDQVEVHTKIKVRVLTWYDDEGSRLA